MPQKSSPHWRDIEKSLEAYFEECKGEPMLNEDGTPCFNKRGEPMYLKQPRKATNAGFILACKFGSRDAYCAFLEDSKNRLERLRTRLPEEDIDKLLEMEVKYGIDIRDISKPYSAYKRGVRKLEKEPLTPMEEEIFPILDGLKLERPEFQNEFPKLLNGVLFKKIEPMIAHYRTILLDKVEQELFTRDGSMGAKFWLSAQDGWAEKQEVTNKNEIVVALVDDDE